MTKLIDLKQKKALVSLRVSTDEQSDKGGFPRQERACLEYAKTHGIEVVGIYKDDFTGSVPIGERPEGARLMADLLKGKANVLILENASRLHRPKGEGYEAEVAVVFNTLQKAGVELHTTDRGHVKTFLDLLVLLLDSMAAGQEYRQITKRTTEGRNNKARKRQVVGSPKAPYGYKFVRDKRQDGSDGAIIGLEIVPHEAKTVELIYKWYVLGEDGTGEKPIGSIAITKRLTDMGIEKPWVKHGFNRYSGWCMATVLFILENQIYAGVWHYGKRIGKNGKGGKRPIGEQIAVSVPAIIPAPLWQAAQERRANNKLSAARNSRRLYLLRGRIKCHCGGSMSGQAGKKGKRDYRCTYDVNRNRERTCTQKRLNADRLEMAGWKYLYDAMRDRDVFEESLREAQAQHETSQAPKRARLDAVNATLAEVEKRAGKLAATIENQDGVVADMLQVQVDAVNSQHKALTEKRDKLLTELELGALTNDEIDFMLNYRDNVIVGMQDASPQTTPEAVMRTFEVLDLRLKLLSETKAIFSCRLPVEPRVIDLSTS